VVQAWRDTVLKTNSAKYLDTREIAVSLQASLGEETALIYLWQVIPNT